MDHPPGVIVTRHLGVGAPVSSSAYPEGQSFFFSILFYFILFPFPSRIRSVCLRIRKSGRIGSEVRLTEGNRQRVSE